MTDAAPSGAPPSSDIYYSGNYWNNRPEVVAHLNRRATGDDLTAWWRHLGTWHGRPFERVLAFNCGNGWVERDLLNQGVARSAVGTDISADLLAEARAAAATAGLPIDYVSADINRYPFGPSGTNPDAVLDGVDCVVNYAAGHHVTHVDAVFRRFHRMLPPDGVFVSWDYTGPHRNQYRAEQWEAVHELNHRLPARLRKHLVYPHLPTMLVSDPTEAVHSELVLPTIERYFDVHHLRHLGGGLAYELLTFNDAFFDPAVDTSAEVAEILAADAAYTDADPAGRSLFSYVIATPKAELPDAEQLEAWTREELERERRAGVDGGRYGPSTLVGDLTETLERLERELAAERGTPAPPGTAERLGSQLDRAVHRVDAAVRWRIERARAKRS